MMFCLTIYWVCPRRCPFHAISVMLESVCLANSAIHRGRGNTSFCTARPLVNWLADSFCKTRWQHDWPGSNRWVSHNLCYNIHTSVAPASNSELTTSISHPHIDCAHITTRKCCTHATTRQSKIHNMTIHTCKHTKFPGQSRKFQGFRCPGYSLDWHDAILRHNSSWTSNEN